MPMIVSIFKCRKGHVGIMLILFPY